MAWSNVECVGGHAIEGSGGRLRHDVGVTPEAAAANDHGAILELKWLTGAATGRAAQDIWKLALSRSTVPEGTAVRAYLALSGAMGPVKDTLAGLRNIGLTLRWSPAGTGTDWPKPSSLNLGKAIATPVGSGALRNLLKHGDHFRNPPDCWTKLRASLRWRWYQRVDCFRESEAVAWRFLLWELDHWAVGANSQLDWTTVLAANNVRCNAAV